jgi:hypothetical protein
MHTRSRRAAALVLLGVLLTPYLALFNYIETFEVGLAWNRATGDLWLQGPGMHWTAPWVSVSRIDTRPQRVCVVTSGRGFSCKLVQFESTAYREFVATEGHRYYWWSNRFSFNSGHSEEYRGMRDILLGYGYGAKQYPFVVTLRNLEGTQGP